MKKLLFLLSITFTVMTFLGLGFALNGVFDLGTNLTLILIGGIGMYATLNFLFLKIDIDVEQLDNKRKDRGR